LRLLTYLGDRYYKLASQLNGLNPGKVRVPAQRREVTIVGDSLQLSLPGASKDQIKAVVAGTTNP
jgi:hypothetical protein